jgi:hypothetical protein
MRGTRCALTVVSALLLGLATAPAALAVPCGQPTTGATQPTVGELALDTAASDDPTLSFKDHTDPRDIAFVFTVTGCTLGQDTDVKIKAIGDEHDALALKDPEPKGDLLVVSGTVNPDDFRPGTHKPTLVVSSPSGQVKSQKLRIVLDRKEPPGGPFTASLVGLLVGFLYAILLGVLAARSAYDKQKAEKQKKETDEDPTPPTAEKERKVTYQPGYFVVSVVGAAGLTYAAYKTGYLDSATWTPEFGSYLALFAASAAASAGGAAAGLIKAVTPAVVPSEPDPPKPPEPEPPSV